MKKLNFPFSYARGPIFRLGLVAACAFSGGSPACDLCSIYSATEASGEAGLGPFAGAAVQFSHFGTVQIEGQKVPNPSGQYLDSVVSQVFLGYNFSQRFGLQFNLPVIYRSFKRPDGLGGIDRGTEAGLGDVALLGNFAVYRQMTESTTLYWALLGGVKFPTGSTRRIAEEFNEVEDPVGPPSGVHGHDLTLGSGSFDGIVGTTLYGRWRRAFFAGNVQYTIRTEGDFDYRFANDLTWSGGPGFYLVMAHAWTLGLQFAVSGEHKGTDTFQGASAEDTGVTSVYVGPQVTFTLGSRLSAQLAADIPVSIDNTALQTVPDYRLRAGLTWRF